MLAILILAGSLCGADAQEYLWASVKGDRAQEARVAVTLANFDSFSSTANRQAFLDVFEDVVKAGGDLDAGAMAKIAGRAGVTVEAVEEYFAAVNYYRRGDGTLIPGLATQANEGATRNLARVAGAVDVNPAVAEMLEPVAARRMGITPDSVRSFGEKIDVSDCPLPYPTTTIEADTYLTDLTFMDAKWTTLEDLTLKRRQIDNLTFVLSNPQIREPITKAVFPTTVPVSASTQALIDEANQAIRTARGITDPFVVFIEPRSVGPFR